MNDFSISTCFHINGFVVSVSIVFMIDEKVSDYFFHAGKDLKATEKVLKYVWYTVSTYFKLIKFLTGLFLLVLL